MVDLELRPRPQKAVTVDLSQQLENATSAIISGQHKRGWLQLDLFVARQEPAHVTSAQNALVADVVLEGTASASGQLRIEQRAQKSQPQGNQAPHATRVPDEEIIEKPPKAP